MDQMTVRWEPDFPPDVRAIVEPVLVRWLDLVPTWCQEFIVRYDGKRDARMATTVNYRSRFAVLIVTGMWFDDSPHERENSLLHELAHVLLEPMCAAVVRIIEDVTPKDTPLRELADSTFSDGMEASVEDMARAIGRLVGPPAANEADLVQVDPHYFAHLRHLEELAIADGTTTPTAWEAP